MIHHIAEWLGYAAGAGGTLALKCARYLGYDRSIWGNNREAWLKIHNFKPEAMAEPRFANAEAPWLWHYAAWEWVIGSPVDDQAGKAQNAVSWLTTLGWVWTFGAVYINRMEWLLEYVKWLPLHPAIAFVLGTLNEAWAPELSKWLVAKLVPK